MLHNLTNLFDGSEVNLFVAFFAGLVTFFASCLLPLIPTYLAYLSGVSLNDTKAGEKRWLIVRVALSFVSGFIATFVILGLLLSTLAGTIAVYRPYIERAGGVLFIILGFFMLGIFKHKFFSQERRFELKGLFSRFRYIHAFLTGIVFGFGWTPCIGPVLAVILFWSAQQATAWQGALLLTTYGVGLGVPFVLVAAAFETLIPWLKKHAFISTYVNLISALVIILAGVLLLFGQFQRLSLILLQVFNFETFAR